MTKGTLVGIRSKLKWADAHLTQLKSDFVASTKEPDNRLVYHGDANGLHATINTHEPALEWALMAGNVIHQIRSSLDHLVFQLVLQHPRKRASFIKATKNGSYALMRAIQFPICKSADDFTSNHRIGHLRKLLSAREFAAIESTQPYKRNPADPTRDWLYVLSALDNIDKHRTVLVIEKRASIEGGVEYGGVRRAIFNTGAQKLKPGAKFLTIAPSLIRPNLKVKVEKVTFYITFSDTEGACDDKAVLDTLRRILIDVETIIEKRFSRYFSP